MKKIVSAFFAWAFSIALFAHPVDGQQARRLAMGFLQQKGCAVVAIDDLSAAMPYSEFYTFSFRWMRGSVETEGFVIVAGDDCMYPVLAYSLENAFRVKDMPAHVSGWLQGYEEEIAFRRQCESDSGETPQPPVLATAVSPLLSTTWDQEPYYNNLCPYDGVQGGRSVTGCTATATAQVMKYWNHPTTGCGSHSYTTTNCGTQSADFSNTTYDWTNMPNSLNAYSTATQLQAVGKLMYHVGVAVEMEYRYNSSSAATTGGALDDVSAENALKRYFKYSPALHSVSKVDYSNDAWCALLRNELDNSRPVLYSGRDNSGGHAFVLDGYNNNGQFHVNWGWGGYCDGYYTMGTLNPSSGGTGGNTSHSYNLSNAAVIGIEPNYNFSYSGTTTVTATPSIAAGSISGAGTYAYGDTVTLRATATAGCRFSQWSDGSKDNPRQFIAQGGSWTFTAQIDSLKGDTLSYCISNNYLSGLGSSSGGTKRWGVRFPVSALTPQHDLQEVQLYVRTAGTYTMTIYLGSTTNSAVQFTQSYTISNSNAQAWNTFVLPTPVPISGTEPLWVTFQCSDVNYPAAMTYSSGNSDAMLWASSYNSIISTWDYSWMIRAIFVPTNLPPEVTINGPNIVYVDQTCFYSATGSSQSSFSWEIEGGTPSSAVGDNVAVIWNTPGVYDVICTAQSNGLTATDTMHVLVVGRYNVSFFCEGEGSGRIDTAATATQTTTSANFCGRQLTLVEGTPLTVIAVPHEGSMLEHFYVDGVDRIDDMSSYAVAEMPAYSLDLTVDHDITIRSVMSRRSYDITVTAAPDYAGTVSGAGQYQYEDTATLTATANDGYRFVRWDDGVFDNPRTVVVTADKHYVALFEEKVSISPVDSETPVVVYPNPATEVVTISLSDGGSIEQVGLVTLDGRTVREWHCRYSQSQTLSLEGVSDGLYLLRIKTTTDILNCKLVVRSSGR